MNKEYRYQGVWSDHADINFRYGDDGIDYSSRLVEPSKSGVSYLKTEHDVIMAWADFAKDALEGVSPDADSSGLKCWSGHYEQFGMVILTLANMTRYRKNGRGEWNPLYESTLWPGLYDNVYEGPTGTECRNYYRCWFSIIGHPDYQRPSFGPEFVNNKDKELALCIALESFMSHLVLRKKPA